tara:strand:- start:923 stop:1174 length:252 start_codon:yes stop_codon:yes gene_type:complete
MASKVGTRIALKAAPQLLKKFGTTNPRTGAALTSLNAVLNPMANMPAMQNKPKNNYFMYGIIACIICASIAAAIVVSRKKKDD